MTDDYPNTETIHANDPALTSWVESANHPGTDFPIQNLPFGVFSRAGDTDQAGVGVAIGGMILDLAACWNADFFKNTPVQQANLFAHDSCNRIAALGRARVREIRERVSWLLRHDTPTLRDDAPLRERCLLPMKDATMRMPFAIGDYTDFYASANHATNVGKMFRPDGDPLLPNYKHLPVGYHGRASSVVVSGTPIRRPHGQLKPEDGPPVFGPCRLLDHELELGCFIASGNDMGSRIGIDEAPGHVFGIVLVNDWSARDIQKWEYVPLGPFNAKNFGTTISPWVVTLDALAPFCKPLPARPASDPAPLPYLSPDKGSEAEAMGLDIRLEVYLESKQMRDKGVEPMALSHSSGMDLYWTFAQMIAHHTSTGCNLRPGDLLASGTVSGVNEGQRGCMLELTWRGQNPVQLPTGEERKFLADGDRLLIKGHCEGKGAVRIGFGECSGVVTAAE